MKDAIERAEPGVHQFAKLRVIPRKGQAVEVDYYVLNVCNLVRAIDGTASTVEFNLYDDGARKVYRAFRQQGKKLVVGRELIAGKAVWMDSECQGNFISDELHDVIASLGARNLELVQVEET